MAQRISGCLSKKMIRKNIVFLFCWIMIATVLAAHCCAQEITSTKGQQNHAEYKLFEAVSADAVQAFSCMKRCNENTAKLFAASSNKVSSAFIASKVAWLSGHPTDAITTLENIIQSKGHWGRICK
jgi:hypothetical protein